MEGWFEREIGKRRGSDHRGRRDAFKRFVELKRGKNIERIRLG